MNRLKRLLTLFIILIIITSCTTSEYKLNEDTKLKGIITSTTITKDGKTYNVSYLNLEDSIIIDGTKISKIAIDYNYSLKDNTEVTLSGKLIKNSSDLLDLSYSIEVNDIDNILSYINTFSNEDFSMTIPTDIIKLCIIEKISNGFTIYKNNNDHKIELFSIISISNQEFNTLREESSFNIEKITSNKEKTVIIKYSNADTDDNYEEYDKIISNISKIKDTVVLK